MTADSDALRAELERTKEELERVRRNHLRRMIEARAGAMHRAFWSARNTYGYGQRQVAIGKRLNQFVARCRAALEWKNGA